MPLPGTIQYITVHGVYQDSNGNPSAGSITFAPPPQLVDAGSSVIYGRPVSVNLDATGAFSVSLVCTDNPELVPVGWYYTVTERIGGATRSYPVFLPHTLGTSVDFSTVVPIPTIAGTPAIIPSGIVAPGYGGLAYTQTWSGTNTFAGPVVFTNSVTGVSTLSGVAVSGTPTAGYVLTAATSTTATWQAPTGGIGGGVSLAGDLGGTTSVPQVVSTHLAAPLPLAQGGTAGVDAPSARTSLGLGGAAVLSVGTSAGTVAAGNDTRITGALQASNNLSEVTPATARTNLGLGTAAVLGLDTLATDIAPLGTQAAGATGKIPDAGHVHAMPTLTQVGAPTADLSMGSHKITALTAGVAGTDAANVSQIPTSLPPSGAASGDLSGTYPSPTVAKINGVAVTGTPAVNYVLTATSTTAATWSAPTAAPAPATTVAAGTAYGQSTAVGTLNTYAREDHSHGTPALTVTAPATTLGIGQGAALGTATLAAKADHVHPLAAAAAPAASAVGDTVVTGVATTFAASDHKHARETFAAPTATTAYGLSAVTGTATTLSHSDHTHGTPALTTTAPATTLAIGTAAALGSATLPALADHVHPVAAAAAPTASAVGDTSVTGVATTFAASDHKHAREAFAAPVALTAFSVASATGTATTLSHSDHVHGSPALPSATTAAAGIVQLDGTAADIAALGTQAAGSVGKAADAGHVHPTTGLQLAGASAGGDLSGTYPNPAVAKVNGVTVTGTPAATYVLTATSATAATWQAASGGSGTPATTVTDETVYGVAKAVGTLTSYAREDHTHGSGALSSTAATTSALGDAAAVGTATAPARSDHKHGRESFGAVTANTVFSAASSSGSATTPSRSDHVHGLPDSYSEETPKQRGWSEWNYVILGTVPTGLTLVSGTVVGASLIAQSAATIGHIVLYISATAITPTAGQNLAGLYHVSGTTATQVAVTGDLGTWTATGINSYALGSSVTLVPGDTYFIMLLTVASTAMKVEGYNTTTSSFYNGGLNNATAGPWFKFFGYASSQTTLPASFTISSSTMSNTNAQPLWFALAA